MPLQNPPPLEENAAKVLESAQGLVHWITERQDGLEISTKDEARVPGLLFDLSLEHHVGIVHLVHGRINGAAFALLRANFETLVRGAWLQLCATPEELAKFVEKDRIGLEFGQLIEAIEKHDDFADKALSALKHSSWKAMNSYTHGGMLQVVRRIKKDTIEPAYDPEEIIEVLKASGTFALIALQQIARLCGKDDLVSDIEAKLKQGGG